MPDPVNLDLIDLVARHTDFDGTHATAYPPLTLLRAAETAEPAHIVQEPSLCVIAQGRKRILFGERMLVYDAEHYLLASLDLPIAGEVLEASPEQPYLALRLNLDPSLVAEYVGEGPTSDGGHSLTVDSLDAALREALVRLLRLLDDPERLPTLAPLVHREILYRLLTGPQGGRLRAVALGKGPSGLVARAVVTLRRDFDRPLRIAALARELGVSESGFHHHFKAITALSLLQFQKRLRLQEARRLILSAGEDAAGAAFRVGYESPSQFSREYRRLFGVPPEKDGAPRPTRVQVRDD